MGKAVKSIGKLTGSSSTATVKPKSLEKSYWDISDQTKQAQSQFAPLLQQSQQNAASTAPNLSAVLGQMGQAALGQTPSVAAMQMKAAQDRNLAQQLAIMQASRGGNAALNQRALLQNMTQSGRQLAQDSGIARLQEQQQNQQNFLNAANMAQQQARADIGANLDYGTMAKQSLQQYELADKGALNAAQAQNAALTQQQRGAMFGAATNAAQAAIMSDENQKVTNDGKDRVKARIGAADINDYLSKVKSAIAESAKRQQEGQEAGAKAAQGFADAIKKRKEMNAADAKIAPQMATFAPAQGSIIAPPPAASPMAAGMGGSILAAPVPASPMAAGMGGSIMAPAPSPALSYDWGSDKRNKNVNDGKGYSDEKSKKESTVDVDKKMQKFVDMLSARAYHYKDASKPGTAEGQRYGVMAQDLEKSDVGASMVEDTPQGKMVNYGQGFGAILASQAALNDRLKKLESKKKKKDA